MNILIVTGVFPPEPVVAATIVHDIAVRLSEEGHHVTVICPPPSRPYGFDFRTVSQEYAQFGRVVLDSYTCPKSSIIGRFKENVSFGRKVVSYIQKHHQAIDVIYVNSWPIFSQYLIVKKAKCYGIRVVMHIQDIYPEALNDKLPTILHPVAKLFLGAIDTYLQQHSDKVITIGSTLSNYLRTTRKLKKEQIDYVYNWQNIDIFKQKVNQTKIVHIRPLTFMFLGSLGTIPCLDIVINAFVEAKIDNSRLVIAGSGVSKDALIAQATKYTHADIQFMDARKEQVATVLGQADILLLTLKRNIAFYALPSKLIAYMMSANPIIATAELDTDLATIIESTDCGWVIEPENKGRLIDVMKKAAEISESESRSMGLRGYEFACKELSKEKNLSKITAIILNKS